MELITTNWEYILIGILCIDKVVALSPTEWDDLIWTSIKKAWTLKLFSDFFRGFFFFILLVVAWNLWAFANLALGSIEDNYYLIYGIFLQHYSSLLLFQFL